MNQKIDVLLAEMTLEEKVNLLHGKGLWKTRAFPGHGIPDFIMTDGSHGVRFAEAQVESENLALNLAGVIGAENEPEKTSMTFDVGASKPATCFPNGSSLACSFDTELIERMGRALGAECQNYGIGLLLGPGMNIRRMPLAGRGYEYYSEDPVVSGDIAAAMVRGIQSMGVGASIKHFACNNSEYHRNTTDSVVEERALREIYLYGFERALKKSDPWTVMSSYNILNGEQASHNAWLLNDVLRGDWGYEGVVVSDWMGVTNRVRSMWAGNDLEMPQNFPHARELIAAAEGDADLRKKIDLSCRRMLTLIFRIKNMENPTITLDHKKHHALAREIAAQSMVLLKNADGVLPLDRSAIKTLAVIGRGAESPIIQGAGCATTTPTQVDIPLEEIRKLAGDGIEVRYAPGASEKDVLIDHEVSAALEAARGADAVVFFANTPTNENGEDSDAKDLHLCPSHEMLIEKLAEVNPALVVVLANGDAIETPWLDSAKAVLEGFFSGQGAGRATAEILFGDVNPSGRLTVTMPNCLEETPAFIHYPGENGKHFYSEGIYVGYRYYGKRGLAPKFPFGYGLSYTTFAYANLRLSASTLREGDTLDVQVDVRNTGDRAGREVVQLYVSDLESRLARPKAELKGFAKIALQPGETKTVAFTLDRRDFCYYDPGYGRWIFESGAFDIHIGRSAADMVLTTRIEAIANFDYPQYLTEDADIDAVLSNKQATEALKKLLKERLGISGDNIETVMRESLGLLTFVNVRYALQSELNIEFSDAEYSAWITAINQSVCGQ
ncbi:glycoside hydrolase family 3 C-terminal domain-containing protein [Oscillospiraceae bacterium OttesenSCG-928-F05]|nr:glycoside hydrolase family 3 C-terminal domain-containing protein [Oscillospiraceae bacterium OttesenSCG-928-F05]